MNPSDHVCQSIRVTWNISKILISIRHLIFLVFLSLSGGAWAQLTVPNTLYTGGTTQIVQLKWTCSYGDNHCIIEEKTGSSWSEIRTTGIGNHSRSLTRSVGSHTFRFTGCTKNDYGYVVYCSVDSSQTVTIKRIPSAPSIDVPSTSKTGAYQVDINPATDATYYKLWKRTNSGSWAGPTTYSGNNPAAFGESMANGIYSYKAQACNAGGCSSDFAVKTVEVSKAPGVPSSITVPSVNNGSYTVSWGSSTGDVKKYVLERRVGSGEYTQIYENGVPGSKSETVNAGSYTYRVKACHTTLNFPNCSGYRTSGVVSARTPSSAPAISLSSATSTSGTYTVSWNSISNSSSYVLEERVNSDGWSTVQSSSARSKGYSGKSSDSYSYRVQACNRLGCSAFSSVKTVDVARPLPVPASITVPSAATDGSYSVNWASVSGTTKYELQRQLGSGSWSTVQSNIATSKSESGLAKGSYTYRVKACRVVGQAIGCSTSWRTSSVAIVSEPAVPPSLTLAATSGSGSYTVGWNSVGNTSSYVLEENGQALSSISSTSKSFSGGSAKGNGTYSYRVKACNAVGCSAYSGTKTIDVSLAPDVPLFKSIPEAAVTSEIYLSWENSSTTDKPVTTYKLERGDSQIYSGLTRSFKDTVSNAGSYTYSVKACHTTREFENCSDLRTSAPVTVVKQPSMPTLGFERTVTGSGVVLDWGGVKEQIPEKVDYFILEYSLNDGLHWFFLFKTGEDGENIETSYTYSSTEEGEHRFGLLACVSEPTSDGNFEVCSSKNIQPPPVTKPASAPTWPSDLASISNDGSDLLEWNTVTDTAYYRLQKKAGSEWPEVTSTARDFHEVNNFSGRHTYRLQACNQFGCSAPSSQFTLDVALRPDVPILSSTTTLSDGDYTIAWNDVYDDVTHYELQESTNNGANWTTVLDENGSSKITGLNRFFPSRNEGTYLYRVAAFNTVGAAANKSAWSTPYTITVAAPEVPDGVRVTEKEENNYTIVWDAVDNTREYKIYETGSAAGTWNITSTSKGLLDKEEGTYSYQITACNNIGCSALSAPASVEIKITPSKPGALSATANPSTRRTSLSWGAASGSPSRYEVQQRLGSGDWSASEEFTGTSGTWPTAVTTAGTYQYQVRACRTMGSRVGCSTWVTSNAVTYSVPATPTLQAPDNSSDGSYTVSWNSVSNAEHYVLEENGSAQTVTGTTKTFSDSTAKEGGLFEYQVKACNPLGCSPLSVTKTVRVRAAADSQSDPGGNPDDGAVVVSLPPSGPAGGTPVGSIGGEFRVNEAGAATYSIPLLLPEGTAGVTPQLSFNYSSQGGNGIMGQGWSLNEISGITRCRQTLAQDGQARPVTWSSDDRFCLNGQRLMLDSGNFYGAIDATYKTEIESFVTVTSHGGTAGHPSSFTVQAKDGSTSTYGGTTDSHLKAGTHTLTWAISRFADNMQNRIDFYYTGDATTGQRIERIEYAYPDTDTESDSSPGASVEFTYEDRPDSASSWASGYEFHQTKRLASVAVKNAATGTLQEYRSYYLEYQTPETIATDDISRLASVEECVAAKCLEKTRFEWPPMPGHIIATAPGDELVLGDVPKVYAFQNLDINADGNLDLAWVQYRDSNLTEQYLYYALARPDGGYGPQTQAWAGNFTSDLTQPDSGIEIHVVDYNADGRGDILARQKDAPAGEEWSLFLAVADGANWALKNEVFLDLPFANEQFVFGDMNSDGMVDGFYLKNNQLRVHYLNKLATDASSHNRHYRYSDSPQHLTLNGLPTHEDDDYWTISHLYPGGSGDFNGDGRMDVLVVAEYFTIEWHTGATEPGPVGHGRKIMAFVAGNEPGELEFYAQVGSGGFTPNKVAMRTADLNGDGLSDVLFKRDETWKYRLSTGTGWSDTTTFLGFPEVEDKAVFITDINRDSYPDLLVADENDGVLVHYWQPAQERFKNDPGTFANIYLHDDDHLTVLDVDGDGWNDLLHFNSGQTGSYNDSAWSTTLANQKGELSPNLITGITDGLGNQTDITYELLTHSDNYSRVDVGDVVTRELEEVCTPHAREPRMVCYTPLKHTVNTSDFYQSLNDPFSTLPEGNDHLDEPASPVLELHAPMPVVTNVASTAPVAGDPDAKSEISYYYDQLKFQAAGRGSLGFRRLITFDHQSAVTTETTYRQDWPFIGSPLKTVVTTGDGHTLSEATNTWGLKSKTGPDGTVRYQSYIKEAVEENYALRDDGATQGELLSTTTTSNLDEYGNLAFDDYGNPTRITTVTEGNSETLTKVVTNTYGDDEWNKQFGRLSATTVETTLSNANGIQTQTRRSSFEYIASGDKRGLLWKEIIEPDSPLAVTTTYTYDDFGNQQMAVKQAADGTMRESATTEYANGRYVTTVTNALGHVTREVVSRNRFGSPTHIRDIHGVETEIRYNDLGQEYLRQDDTGAWTWQGSVYCDSGIFCPPGSRYRVEQRVAGGGSGYTYHDSLGREMRKTTVGFNGLSSNVDTEYDNLGRVKRVSTPYGYLGPTSWTKSAYDILGRVTEITLPNGASGGTTEYDGYDTIITNALGHTKTETRDVSGNLLQVTDNLGGTVSYRYDLNGNLLSATTDAIDANPVTVKMCYDTLGRKIAMHDPDKGGFLGNANATCGSVAQTPTPGWWHYTYNGLGELTGQRDTKGQTQTMEYDALGRMLKRTDRHANGSVEGHTRWYYDADMNGTFSLDGDLGNITYVVQSSGSIDESCSANTHCTANVYDSYGRATDTITFLPGASEAYVSGVRYDSIGRPYRSIDALEGLVQSNSGTRQHYNDYGYKSQITDIATGDMLYKITATNTRGQVVQEERGNGATTTYEYDPYFGRKIHQSAGQASWLPIQDITYDWDVLGNLKSRHNQSVNEGNTAQKDLRESFCYDGLNRLIKSHQGTLNGSCALSASQQDVEYDGLGNITRKAGIGSYSYGANAGPHAVTNAGGTSYTYDNNGNMTGGDGRTLQYSTFDKATEISKGGHVTQFSYGPDRSRYQRVDIKGGISTTTTYIGNIERIQKEGESTITWRRTVAGAIYTITTDLNHNIQGSTDKAFIYKDHLGSTDVITDIEGTVIESHSFDPWGQRRNSENWSNLTSTQLLGFTSNHTKHGYTGHEQMDEMGLVHMNGRIYDAKLGRFLQADPFIQAASNTQSYNRYSYVMNNPLNMTDPSGYSWKGLWNEIRPFVGAVVGVVLSIWCWGCGPAAVAAIGGVSGAVGAAANGGNILKGAITGAISAVAFYGIGQGFDACQSCFASGKLTATAHAFKTVSHAMAGGVMSILQGGKFGHGFAAAGFTQAFARGIDAIGGDPKVNPTAYFSAGARVARIIVAATVGGTASKMSGGKFANGAVTAAFSRGFNDEAHAERLDELAIEALDKVNPKSIRINREFGGLFYKTKEGELGYTPAVIGDEDGVLPGSTRSLVPEGAEVIGDYHTHAHYSTVDSAGNVVKVSSRALDTFNSDYFSNADLNSSRDFAREIPGYRSYLGTPSGHYLKYELIDGGDVVFQIK